jgi:hypothetical protein
MKKISFSDEIVPIHICLKSIIPLSVKLPFLNNLTNNKLETWHIFEFRKSGDQPRTCCYTHFLKISHPPCFMWNMGWMHGMDVKMQTMQVGERSLGWGCMNANSCIGLWIPLQYALSQSDWKSLTHTLCECFWRLVQSTFVIRYTC